MKKLTPEAREQLARSLYEQHKKPNGNMDWAGVSDDDLALLRSTRKDKTAASRLIFKIRHESPGSSAPSSAPSSNPSREEQIKVLKKIVNWSSKKGHKRVQFRDAVARYPEWGAALGIKGPDDEKGFARVNWQMKSWVYPTMKKPHTSERAEAAPENGAPPAEQPVMRCCPNCGFALELAAQAYALTIKQQTSGH